MAGAFDIEEVGILIMHSQLGTTELNSHVGTRGNRSVETNRLGHQGGGQELMEALAGKGIAHACRSAGMFQHVAASTHAHNMYNLMSLIRYVTNIRAAWSQTN